ncbi:hypothetical protein FHR83_005678 [Actinoplanes campanulatus]|uniref:Formylglycine-generating enzyme, required for sulfatase activity, contains SUMF1/FGE domain n=1 Tax=Actinoplanes campanulatus TaxID=113559 RepID=A0A7W5AKK8_9ACTN|nr:hypothetical protein [Actinoplanes campanulatus]MBB3097993.1 hypothetical protein [Actinoplanes campanulatus]GGN31787.1 hypothetical protein GCM10010109_52310 [Actinoplanes campanulatus]GID41381.1 hypothetical protein Aca09nite_78870 [Actinoplanes campanulatus]
MIIDAAQWFGLDTVAAEKVATSIAVRSGAELAEFRAHEYAGRRVPVAGFVVGGERFAFVPGGEVTVGFDGDRFEPTPQQEACFADSAAEYGIERDIRQFTDSVTSPRRTVVVPPLLVAVEAVEAGAVAVPPDHPDIVRRVDRLQRQPRPAAEPAPGQAEWAGAARVTLRPDWTVEAAWLLDAPSYDGEVARLAGLGQRLLTPDEWEHACGAGATTLFRWGDANPESDPWSARTGPHRGPNLFGLNIGQDPYREERTAIRDVLCGGDGGTAVCGGSGSFLPWLTIATAFRDDDHAAEVASDDDYGTMRLRPAIPLT